MERLIPTKEDWERLQESVYKDGVGLWMYFLKLAIIHLTMVLILFPHITYWQILCFVSSSFVHETVMIYYHAYFYILQILYLSQNIIYIKCLKYIIWQ